ncbi:DUF72 domain-containing protein [Dyadobacter bucti]|uniref:DUF72 domain-containing protein n=1 Tax=Dyadobacter bucti TaxID=2572203 RepID=UPI003F72615C
MNNDGSFYLGTSGLVLPFKNKQSYPAEFEGKSRLNVYGTLFNSIEINSIFYKLPRLATVRQWSDAVSKDFRYTFKLWKQISHSPTLNFDPADLQRYFQVIAGAEKKRGCILVQFPPSVKVSLFKSVASLLSGMQDFNENKWPVAVEFRSPSWYSEHTYELLNDYNAALVYHDKSGSQPPLQPMEADHIYLRFHGPGGNYRGSYDQGLLYEYAGYVREWMSAGKTVYVYFNNTMGAALDNLQTFEKFLREEY